MKNTIRVLLADDQSLIREGLRLILELQSGIRVVGEASNGQEVLDLMAHTPADVVLMDVEMPFMDGIEATRAICMAYPQVKVIILTTFEKNEYIFEGIRAGAIGYLLKDTTSEKLAQAIRAAARGESVLQPSVASKVLTEFNRLSHKERAPAVANARLIDPLSTRQLDVLAHLAEGKSNREIAAALFLTEGTVKNHLTSILGKLGVRDRTQAALKARELGML